MRVLRGKEIEVVAVGIFFLFFSFFQNPKINLLGKKKKNFSQKKRKKNLLSIIQDESDATKQQ